MNFIEIKNVVKRYNEHTALNGVSMDIAQGCIYGLLGPNGAGKTSLIRIINQITHQDSGEVLFKGAPIKESDVNNIGYLPEERGLYKKMKVADHIVYIGRLKGMTKQDATQQMRFWLDRFELSDWANKKVEALSKGMAQKVQFICTVLHRPELLIFDEPFSGFDPVNAEKLKAEILRLRDEGATIIFSTHNMDSVEAVCQEISLIDRAEVVLQGNVNEIRQNYKKHIYNVHISQGAIAPNSNLFTIEGISPAPTGGTETRIRLNDGVAIRDVVNLLNSQYPLCGFHELLPSMHEIFIETVTGRSQKGDLNNE